MRVLISRARLAWRAHGSLWYPFALAQAALTAWAVARGWKPWAWNAVSAGYAVAAAVFGVRSVRRRARCETGALRYELAALARSRPGWWLDREGHMRLYAGRAGFQWFVGRVSTDGGDPVAEVFYGPLGTPGVQVSLSSGAELHATRPGYWRRSLGVVRAERAGLLDAPAADVREVLAQLARAEPVRRPGQDHG